MYFCISVLCVSDGGALNRTPFSGRRTPSPAPPSPWSSPWAGCASSCGVSFSPCCGSTCRRCRRSGGWSCGTARESSGCKVLRRSARTSGSQKSPRLGVSIFNKKKLPKYTLIAQTLRDFFLLIIFVSYMSILRLTANILALRSRLELGNARRTTEQVLLSCRSESSN